ncbi:MAG: hypothetical protein LBN05_05035 [Oscillospiraceae bacterium]|jgi:hypothetical protein|nr:hypothetical protein [Oscillospiraceae bacterium]
MACFIVPAAEAVVTTVATKILEKKQATATTADAELFRAKTSTLVRKLRWLNKLLWGGSFLLAFEHLWHGELTLAFPFLTAAGDAASMTEMLREMATSGVAMAAVVTLAWLGLVLVTSAWERKAQRVPVTVTETDA